MVEAGSDAVVAAAAAATPADAGVIAFLFLD